MGKPTANIWGFNGTRWCPQDSVQLVYNPKNCDISIVTVMGFINQFLTRGHHLVHILYINGDVRGYVTDYDQHLCDHDIVVFLDLYR